MATTLDYALQQLLGLLDEAWKGESSTGPGSGWVYFGDGGTGLEQTLDGLSAADAARVIGNTSIAGQVKHTAISTSLNAAWLRGEDADTDWEATFAVGELDEAGWAALREQLWSGLAELRREVEAHALDSDRNLAQAHGAVAHVVYHLGAVRAKQTAL
jgi:hypothetical protein